MNPRYIGAAIIAPLLIFIFLGGYYLSITVFLLSLAGVYEFYKASKSGGHKPIEIVGYILTILYYGYIIFYGNNINLSLIVNVFILSVFILMIVPVIDTNRSFVDVGLTILPLIYVAVFFGFMILLSKVIYGKYFVWLIFISSWGCDTLAYYSGRYLGKGGKHKLIPKVSPNKTVEGAIGGLLGSIIGCSIYGYIISKFGVSVPIYNYVFIGFLGGVFGQCGDLVASSIKRHVGIKDYSNLIPGHGGILDRFDSILLVSVVVYYYITIILL